MAGVTPAGDGGEDQALRRRVEEALAAEAALEAGDVEVAVEGGTVTLRGTVPSGRARRRVEAAARSVQGVREVRNDLTAAT